MAQPTIKELQDEIARLQGELADETQKRTSAEEISLAFAQASHFASGTVEERPTGKTIKMELCVNPEARNVKDHVFKTVEVPTYYYAIKLPAGAGLGISINRKEYYHGVTYEFDPYTLRDVKSMVARTWDHEKSIHGDNENAYRRPTEKRVG